MTYEELLKETAARKRACSISWNEPSRQPAEASDPRDVAGENDAEKPSADMKGGKPTPC